MHLKEDAQGKVIQSVLRGTDGSLHARLHDSYDTNEEVTKIAMLVWDTNTLTWVKSTGGGGVGSQVEVTNFPTDYATEVTLAALSTKILQQREDILRYDVASSTITYVGYAAPGSSAASAVWKIFRLDTTSGIVKLYADGNTNYDNVWNSRAGLSYS